ncbi:cordon-bleu protein-like 1 isoform X3 [Rhinatrema bivittatum]|uniref:cordon-bleu protein-like 1 isoform X3 n=1 Tax=Rhinatrema bivittatum TaxID=194408 RepID=UPI001128C0EC|nr:cordon-bleu protein-like 1 isoform X3 [Rhinatrema bivittatum]
MVMLKVYFRRKTKGKAPLPPAEVKYVGDTTPSDGLESINYTMEQKENLINKEIELTVVLPGDVTTSTTVNGSKPMMDLLVFLCGQYHLNPSTYTVDLISADKSQIKFKPNTPIGMLEVEKAILKPKNVDERNKKATPIIPEQTVRVVINYKKTQKTVMRVSPHVSLQELTPMICSKCEFDPLHTVLLKDYQSQEPLDLTKSLNDLGLRELYAIDNSRGPLAADVHSSSLQDSYQISQNLDMLKQRENEKGFFSFFRRSKKKREQTSSAPATPLLSKQRPASVGRSNTLTRQVDLNTLPFAMPKKRRAPLPPMNASQGVPKEVASSQVRSGSLVLKSVSVDEADKGISEIGIVRTRSLQLGAPTTSSSSLRRTKRKAPLPPSPTSKIQQDQNDENSNEIVFESTEAVYQKPGSEGAYAIEPSPTALVGYEYSLEEIDEKEETSAHHNEESAGTTLETQEVSTSAISTDVPLDTGKNDETSVSANATVNSSKSSEEEKQDSMNSENKVMHSEADRKDGENFTLEDEIELKVQGTNEDDAHSKDIIVAISGGKEENLNTTEVIAKDAAENVKLQDDRLSDYQEPEKVISLFPNETPRIILEREQQKVNEANTKMVKTQDAAIQTAFSYNGIDRNMSNVISSPRDWNLPALQDQNSTQYPITLNSLQQSTMEKSVQVCHSPNQETVHDAALPIKDSTNMHIIATDFTSKVIPTQSPLHSPSKSYPVYKQNSEPKPKPSNEITREYIPKIGMTTYKIVPQGSLEALKFFSNDPIMNKKNVELEPQSHNLENYLKYDNAKESGYQTGNLYASERLSQSGKQYESAAGDWLNGTSSFSHSHLPTSSFKCATAASPTEKSNNFRKELAGLLQKSNNTNGSGETKEKQYVAYPKMKQNSFYLQMQKRVSGLYVESAVARSANTAISPTQNDPAFKEIEKNVLSSSDKTIQFANDLVPSPTESIEKNSDSVHGEKKSEEVLITSPINMDKHSHFPASQSVPLNFEKLKAFATPRPFSRTTPSPFAVAVSSAIRRSQSFSTTSTTAIQPSEQELCNAFSPMTSSTAIKNHSSSKLFGNSRDSTPEQELLSMTQGQAKTNTANNQLNSQVPCKVHRSSSLLEKKTSLPFQNSDPEQIHQCVLAAIRSGEAAAKLKRVYVPSNTLSINGRSKLSHQASSEVQYEH